MQRVVDAGADADTDEHSEVAHRGANLEDTQRRRNITSQFVINFYFPRSNFV